MKRLIVIGKTNPKKWSNIQKSEFKQIKFYRFPEVSPRASQEDLDDIYREISETIEDELSDPPVEVMLQGDFAICHKIFLRFPEVNFVFPIIDKETIKKENDETIEKFSFIGWRR